MAGNDVFSVEEQEGNSNEKSGNMDTVDHFKTMEYAEIVKIIADTLKEFDLESPVHKLFRPGIGPFGEPQIVRVIANRLSGKGISAITKRTPDLVLQHLWAMEFKIVRPFGDNGREAENWSVNMLHPYAGNTSLIGDAIKLVNLDAYPNKGLFVIGYEHNPPKIRLDPLLDSFEVIASQVMGIHLHERIEEIRSELVHSEHQVLRCVGWQLKLGTDSS
jgi:hypothetical protein